MKPNRYYEHKQHAFDSYCKKVLKCEACNGYRQISRHQKRFASLEELSEADMAQLAVYDRYSWEYTAFPVGNAVVLMQKRSTVYGSSGFAFTTTAWAPSRFQAHFLCRHPMYR